MEKHTAAPANTNCDAATAVLSKEAAMRRGECKAKNVSQLCADCCNDGMYGCAVVIARRSAAPHPGPQAAAATPKPVADPVALSDASKTDSLDRWWLQADGAHDTFVRLSDVEKLLAAQQDDKAGQTPCRECWDGSACSEHDSPAAPEGKTEASELAEELKAAPFHLSPHMAYAIARHLVARSPVWTQEMIDESRVEAAALGEKLQRKPIVDLSPVASASSIGDDAEFQRLLAAYATAFAAADSLTAMVDSRAALAAYIDARPPVAAPDAEAIRSAALEEAAAVCDIAIESINYDEIFYARAQADVAANVCNNLANRIRALSQPSPAVKSAEPDYRDLYEKCKREKAAAYERLAKFEEAKMIMTAGLKGGSV